MQRSNDNKSNSIKSIVTFESMQILDNKIYAKGNKYYPESSLSSSSSENLQVWQIYLNKQISIGQTF